MAQLRVAGFSLDTSQPRLLLMSGDPNHDECRSPYHAPSSDDSEDDGASDYAARRRQRPLRDRRRPRCEEEGGGDGGEEEEPPDNLLQRFYDSVDAPCQVACQGGIEDQLDLLTVRVCVCL